MSVRLLDVNAQNHPLREEFLEAFGRVFDSGVFIQGPEVEAFEREAASFVGAGHAVGMSSGTDALLAALMLAGVGSGDEVLVPSFTFFATAGCVSRLGAVPVFCDVCPVCFNIDAADAGRRLSPRTRAVVPVHLFGQSADLDALEALCQKHGLVMIEDVAQSFGARQGDRFCGRVGRVGVTSFFPSKNLGAFGDAGLAYTDDGDVAASLRRLRNHGMEPKYFHQDVGGNFRLDALQAAMLRVKLPHLADYNRARQENAARYQAALSTLPGVKIADPSHCRCAAEQEKALDGARLILPVAYPRHTHLWNQFTVRVRDPRGRDSLRAHLEARGIGCEVYYPMALHHQRCFAGLPPHALAPCPVAEGLVAEVLSLPVYPELCSDGQSEVVAAISDWLDQA